MCSCFIFLAYLRREVQQLKSGLNEAVKLLKRMNKKINPISDQEFHESVVCTAFGQQDSEHYLLEADEVDKITLIDTTLAVKATAVSAVIHLKFLLISSTININIWSSYLLGFLFCC